ncbi:hypothetical protein KOR34_48460 [Posidoniimonas corsicana]|uniref:Leucine Rich repeats (2 copies) n=1 Tax=Posidoniimonas corsicana TaxID=1938618 RepID=A0A5C5UVU8_9BACT|nr:leucine-rich repeat domain-containing protein [Posidoniimonas corsicana]TWT30288.1 hypothetical protein KOR34_48460 [Posidoniimonas corsicana]
MRPASLLRRWFRFRLRTLLIAVAVLAIPFGWRAEQARREAAAIAWVEERGGEINYAYRPSGTLLQKAARAWFGAKKVDRVYLMYQDVTDVAPLARFHEATLISLQSTPVSDVSPLASLTNLQTLDLTNTQAPAQQVERLKESIPGCRINYRPPTELSYWERMVEGWRVSVNREARN